jgi:tRNA1(Val) A37 N6-methylase TrmN6
MVEKPQLGQDFSPPTWPHLPTDLGPDILEHVPVEAQHHTRLLDLGGSHGLHSIRFCQRYPQLSAVIVDLPSALTETDVRPSRKPNFLAERIHLPARAICW